MTAAPQRVPGIGETAPSFALESHLGPTLSLSELAQGQDRLLVMFYPFAFSPTCGSELAALRDRHAEVRGAGIGVVGISCDHRYALAAYAEQNGIPFPLLADFWPHGEVARRFGVFDEERGMALRGTFVVEGETIITSEVGPTGVARDFPVLLGLATAD